MLHLPEILDSNPTVDVYLVPRINTVDGLTQAHIEKWRWQVDSKFNIVAEKILDTDSDEYKFLKNNGFIVEETVKKDIMANVKIKYKVPIIQFPDLQGRIYRNNQTIRWINKVHETLNGFDVYSALPAMEQYCLSHPKTIARQERQNDRYLLLQTQ
jgi:hypothetical protein